MCSPTEGALRQCLHWGCHTWACSALSHCVGEWEDAPLWQMHMQSISKYWLCKCYLMQDCCWGYETAEQNDRECRKWLLFRLPNLSLHLSACWDEPYLFNSSAVVWTQTLKQSSQRDTLMAFASQFSFLAKGHCQNSHIYCISSTDSCWWSTGTLWLTALLSYFVLLGVSATPKHKNSTLQDTVHRSHAVVAANTITCIILLEKRTFLCYWYWYWFSEQESLHCSFLV